MNEDKKENILRNNKGVILRKLYEIDNIDNDLEDENNVKTNYEIVNVAFDIARILEKNFGYSSTNKILDIAKILVK